MNKYSAYILAGGKSSRMGTDKGMLLLNNISFIEHIVTALQKATIEDITIVSSNVAYDFLKCKRIEDIYPNKGPVGGIFTALSHSKNKKNIILSVDVPLIFSKIIKWMMLNYDESKWLTQVKVLDKTNPLIAIYNKKVIPIFKQHLKNNQLKLRQIVDEIPHKTIEIPEKWQPLLQNINTFEDYQNLLK